MVFAHANGFPPASYRQLFEALGEHFDITAFAARPLWRGSDPAETNSWSDLAADLRQAMATREMEKVVGVGHSLGGVLTIMAAASDPSLFSALALVDPVVFSGRRALFWRASKHLGFGHRLPLVRSARRRRARFPDLGSVRSTYAGKSVFSTWESEALDDYVRAGFRDSPEGGVELCYSKDWEARIFEITPASVWSELRRVQAPVLFLRGASSDTFLSAAAKRASRELVDATVIELPDTSHFLPMEQPRRVARAIVDWHAGLGQSV
jgi:pimeloyl-ACP methyl ester carboxylesterase